MDRNPARDFGFAISVLVIAVFAILLILALLSWNDSGMMMGSHYFPFWAFGVIIVVLVVLLIVRIVIWTGQEYPDYRYSRPHWQDETNKGQAPEQVLDARYARGEITREQYLQMQDDLRRGKA